MFKDEKGKIIDNFLYWEFDDIKNVLSRKLTYLALVKYERKTFDNKNYFKYENIQFFKLKNPDLFFKLIEKGIIRVYIYLGIYRSGYKIGKEHDNSVSFGIEERNLLKLYDILDSEVAKTNIIKTTHNE